MVTLAPELKKNNNNKIKRILNKYNIIAIAKAHSVFSTGMSLFPELTIVCIPCSIGFSCHFDTCQPASPCTSKSLPEDFVCPSARSLPTSGAGQKWSYLAIKFLGIKQPYSRSSKTKKVWKTVSAKRSLRRHEN